MTAELVHSDFKRDSGSGSCLGEYHRQCLAVQIMMLASGFCLGFHVRSYIQKIIEFVYSYVFVKIYIVLHFVSPFAGILSLMMSITFFFAGIVFFSIPSIALQKAFACDFVIISGGAILITELPIELTRMCLPASSSLMFEADMRSSNSIPMRSPLPLTDLIALYLPLSFVSFSKSIELTSLTLSSILSSSRTSSTVFPAVHARGLPPNVVPWSPGLKPVATSSVQSIAPIGPPPPSPLASVTMSGLIPYCS